jgi:hypothetical protein
MAEPPRLGAYCEGHGHDQCGHWVGAGVKVIGRKRGPSVALCGCTCHSDCPLARHSFVAEDVWETQCTCQGTDRLKASRQRAHARLEQRRAQQKAAFAEVDLSRRRSASDIQADLLAAYQSRGIDAHTDLRGTAEMMVAATSRTGTRLPRLLAVGMRSLRRLHQDSRTAARDGLRHPAAGEENKRGLRSMGAWTVLYGAVAAAFICGAWLTSGWISVALALLAAFFSLIAAWMMLWFALMSLLSMTIKASENRHRDYD